MKALALTVEDFREAPTTLLGRVCATNVPDFERGAGFLFRKGEILLPEDRQAIATKLASLARSAPSGYALHLLEIGENEVSEDEAGLRLARLVAGPGIELSGPVESRVNLLARRRGLLRIDVPRLDKLNEIPGMAVFTLFDTMAVEAGSEVAGAKVSPLVYPVSLLQYAAGLCQGPPLVDVVPFKPLKVGVVVREQLKPGPRARFFSSVEHKLAWFGAELLDIGVAENNPDSIARWLTGFKSAGAELILHVGGHSSDPLDPLFAALQTLDVSLERLGAPAHPGTLFWLAYWGEIALFGLASCGMFSRTTLADLMLARLLAGEHLSAKALARIGHGGLFSREMAFRFPPYGLKVAQDED